MAESCWNNQGCSHGRCVGNHRDKLGRNFGSIPQYMVSKRLWVSSALLCDLYPLSPCIGFFFLLIHQEDCLQTVRKQPFTSHSLSSTQPGPGAVRVRFLIPAPSL